MCENHDPIISESEDFVDAYAASQLRQCRNSRFSGRSNTYRRRMEDYTEMEFSLDLLSSDDNTNTTRFLNDNEFLQQYRMSKSSLRTLVNKIQQHPVFKHPHRGPKQPPAIYQVMVLLRYLGTEGSGASLSTLRARYKFSVGTGNNIKQRALEAILSLRSQYYHWPNATERRQISKRFETLYGWPNLVAIADGTLNPLWCKPRTDDAGDYSGRKHQYSISTLVFNDDKRRIRYFLTGWPGCTHDNRVFQNSNLFNNPSQYFSESEYALGDSAFEAQSFMIPAFKKPRGALLPRQHDKFNTELSKPRVLSEHTIGIWKNRFPWLRGIRVQLTGDIESNYRIIAYMECTVILHNFLIEEGDNWENDDNSEATSVGSYDDEEGYRLPPLPGGSEKDMRRRQLVCYVDDKFL